MNSRGFLVGAYAASRPDWNTRQVMELYTSLSGCPGITGLELPVAQLEMFQETPNLLDELRPDWVYEVTTLPGTMAQMDRIAGFGLASPVENSRQAAIADLQRVRTLAHALNDHLGRPAVRSITAVSAPTMAATGPAFTRSLAELADGDWAEVALQIEHCDAAVPAQSPAKGFLPLNLELEALANYPTGIVINWGRSAIEARDPDAPVAQVRQARNYGRLGGLVFSGCAATEGAWGVPWADTHSPPAVVCPPGAAANASLMTEERIADTLSTAGADVTLGLKLSVRPRDADLTMRVAFIEAAVDVLTGLRHAVLG